MTDVYDTLPPRLQEVIDLLIRSYAHSGNRRRWIANEMGCSDRMASYYVDRAVRQYGIPKNGGFIPSIRLVYLRAKELGLIHEAPVSTSDTTLA